MPFDNSVLKVLQSVGAENAPLLADVLIASHHVGHSAQEHFKVHADHLGDCLKVRLLRAIQKLKSIFEVVGEGSVLLAGGVAGRVFETHSGQHLLEAAHKSMESSTWHTLYCRSMLLRPIARSLLVPYSW